LVVAELGFFIFEVRKLEEGVSSASNSVVDLDWIQVQLISWFLIQKSQIDYEKENFAYFAQFTKNFLYIFDHNWIRIMTKKVSIWTRNTI
jgi:hypothetical protein